MELNKEYFIIVLMVFFTGALNAQQTAAETGKKEKVLEETSAVVVSIDQKALPSTGTETVAPIGEPNPTPEQQGYTKYTVDGKDYYFKQSGQLQLLYVPKQN